MNHCTVVFVKAVANMTAVVEDILKSEGLGLEDIALFVFHQANLRIIEAVASRLGVDDSRVYNNIDRYGNTTAAAIPNGDLAMLVSIMRDSLTDKSKAERKY